MFGGLGYLLCRSVTVAKHRCGARYLCALLMKQRCAFSFIPQCLRFSYEEPRTGTVTSDNTTENTSLFPPTSSFSWGLGCRFTRWTLSSTRCRACHDAARASVNDAYLRHVGFYFQVRIKMLLSCTGWHACVKINQYLF